MNTFDIIYINTHTHTIVHLFYFSEKKNLQKIEKVI